MTSPGTLDGLRALGCRVVTVDEPEYDAAREIYNSMLDLRPAVVIEPVSTEGVAATLTYSRRSGLPLAVRGGGHSLAGLGSCDDGIMLRLRGLADIEVDADARVARIGGGATWGEVNDATHEHGLATPGGLVTTTGVGGFTTGGGFSLISRAFGLACDNLAGAEVVLADGSVVECGPDAEPDLFWAIRGGGGNFGVVTRFDLRLHAVRDVVGGFTFFPQEPDTVQRYLDLMSGAPRHFNAYLGLTKAPPVPVLPEEWHGRPVAVVLSCFSGDPADHDEVYEPVSGLGEVLARHVEPMPYPVINTLFDELLPFGMRHYWTSVVFGEVPPAAAPEFVRHGRETPNPESGIFFHAIDGACHDVGPDETAWPHRDASWLVGIYGSWHDAADDGDYLGWVRGTRAGLAPHADEGEYVNFAPEGADASQGIYGARYDRLARLKETYDPDNLFRRNQNVSPARR